MEYLLMFFGGLMIFGVIAILVYLTVRTYDMRHPDFVRRRWIYDNTGTKEEHFHNEKDKENKEQS